MKYFTPQMITKFSDLCHCKENGGGTIHKGIGSFLDRFAALAETFHYNETMQFLYCILKAQCKYLPRVIARSVATKQSTEFQNIETTHPLDCFATLAETYFFTFSSFLCHCEEYSDEAIHGIPRVSWTASLRSQRHFTIMKQCNSLIAYLQAQYKYFPRVIARNIVTKQFMR